MKGHGVWVWRSLASIALVGGGAGMLATGTRSLSPVVMGGAFLAATVSGAALGLHLYAGGGRGGPLLAGLASWLGMAAFVGVPVGLHGLREGFDGFHVAAMQLLLGVVPLLAAGVGAAGTTVLCSGMRRARARRHGATAAAAPAAAEAADARQDG